MALLTELRSAGLRLSSRGDQLLVEPKSALTEDLRALIRGNKAVILRELAENQHPRSLLSRRRQDKTLSPASRFIPTCNAPSPLDLRAKP
jgi:TubC N-terminal docking domain